MKLSIRKCSETFYKIDCWLSLASWIVVIAFILSALRAVRSYATANICLCWGRVSRMLQSSVKQRPPCYFCVCGEKINAFLAEFNWVIDAVGVRHFHTISATSWGKQKGQRLRRRLPLRSFCLVFIDAFHSTFQEPKRLWWDKAITALIIIITEPLQICISVQFIALGWSLQ